VRAWLAAALLLVGCEQKAPAPTVQASVDAAPAAEAQRAQAAETLAQNCQMCHSLDLVRAQRLGRAAWEKEVKKMIGWGAPVPAEQAAPLVDLLAAKLGVDVPLPPAEEIEAASAPAAVAPDPEPISGDAKNGAAVYQVACASCHGKDGVGGPIGPTLVHRPVLHRVHDFEEVVRVGRQRMPSVKLEPPAVRDLIAFLLAQS